MKPSMRTVDFPYKNRNLANATVTVYINHRAVMGVIDSAAQVTVMDRTCWDTLMPTAPIGERVSLRQADGNTLMDAILVPNMSFTVGDYTTLISVYVTKLADQLLLGLDFLLSAGAILNLEDKSLTVCGSKVPIELMEGETLPTLAYVTGHVYIPPGEHVNVPFSMTNAPNGLKIFEPAGRWSALGIPDCLIGEGNSHYIPVLNLSSNAVCLKRGSVLGTLEVVNINTAGGNPAGTVRKVKSSTTLNRDASMPAYLKDLYLRSVAGLSQNQAAQVKQILIEFSDIFSTHELDIGCYTGTTHRIDTKDALPVRQRMRRTAINFQDEEEKHLRKLLDIGVIEPSTSEWASPVVLVRKRDGSVRWCIDYRRLNAVTVKDAFPLPLIEECFDALEGVEYLSGLDLASGYYQLVISEADRPKTAFITRYGLFQHTRMGFGLTNAPATFQRAMQEVLKGLTWKQILVYLDDVIVVSKSFETQLENLSLTFQRFRTYNLKLKPKKCQLFKRKLKFLGWMVGSDGISIPSENVEAILKRSRPSNVTEVESFLGYLNYHRGHIKNFAELAAPLYELTGAHARHIPFVWTEMHQDAFNILRTAMTTAPVLRIPNRTGLFILDTDASNIAIGAELSQIQDSDECLIAFGSYALTKEQRRYCTTRKELLAIVRFTRQYRHYLLGRQFTIRTDHHSLAWLMRFKNADGQLARWLEELSQFDMVISHRPGREHVNADWLSRPGVQCDCFQAGSKLSNLPCGGCKYCSRISKQWERFFDDVDDVLPLSTIVPSVQLCNKVSKVGNSTAKNVSVHMPNWHTCFTSEEIHDLQHQNPDLELVLRWINDDYIPTEADVSLTSRESKFYWCNRTLLHYKGSVLYYEWITNEDRSRLLLVVPHGLKDQIIGMCHDNITAGHLSAEKTLIRLRNQFFWRGMGHDCQLYVKSCSSCSQQKKSSRKPRAGLCNYHAGNPLDRVHVDILGPFPVSNNGNRYVLMLVDQFTKWIEAYPIPDQTAETVARKIVDNFIARFGSPVVIHTDQGRQFESDLFGAVCSLLDIAKTRTTPTHPASNGQVERYNRTILAMIRCYLNNGVNKWDEPIPLLAGAIRSMQNRHTGMTANMLMLGREVRRPMPIIFGPPSNGDSPTVPEYVRGLLEDLREAHITAREQLHTSLRVQKSTYDTRLHVTQYQPGDLVYRSNLLLKKGQSRKLQPPWIGPFLVTKKLSEVTYKVQNRRRTFVLHHDNMQPCRDRAVPVWMRRLRHRFLLDLEEPTNNSDNSPLEDFWELVEKDNVNAECLPVVDTSEQSYDDHSLNDVGICDNRDKVSEHVRVDSPEQSKGRQRRPSTRFKDYNLY